MRKKPIYALIATIVLAVAVGLSAGNVSTTKAESEASTSSLGTPREFVVENTVGAEAFLTQGGKAVISTKLEPSTLNLARGGSADVTITITYIAGNQPHNVVDIWVNPEKTILTPPSLARITTPEQRTLAVDTNQLIPGMIPLNAFETFSEQRLTLHPGESKTLTMRISIPPNIPQELVGKEIHFYPDIQVSPREWTRVIGENDVTITISQ